MLCTKKLRSCGSRLQHRRQYLTLVVSYLVLRESYEAAEQRLGLRSLICVLASRGWTVEVVLARVEMVYGNEICVSMYRSESRREAEINFDAYKSNEKQIRF